MGERLTPEQAVEEIAEVLAEHRAIVTGDEDGWHVVCQCGHDEPGTDVNTHLATALAQSSALRGLLGVALRDAADALPAVTEGTDRAGTETWRAHDRDVYSLAIEESQAALRDRADQIEANPYREEQASEVEG